MSNAFENDPVDLFKIQATVYYDMLTKSIIPEDKADEVYQSRVFDESPENYIARLEYDDVRIRLVPDFPTPSDSFPKVKRTNDFHADVVALLKIYDTWFS